MEGVIEAAVVGRDGAVVGVAICGGIFMDGVVVVIVLVVVVGGSIFAGVVLVLSMLLLLSLALSPSLS